MRVGIVRHLRFKQRYVFAVGKGIRRAGLNETMDVAPALAMSRDNSRVRERENLPLRVDR